MEKLGFIKVKGKKVASERVPLLLSEKIDIAEEFYYNKQQVLESWNFWFR